jgi:DNA-binding NarL/FixJ family response regulator
MPVPAKILVVDDHAYVRRTLRTLLKQQSHWEIYEAKDGRAALKQVRELKPDVAVLDIVMPGMGGVEAAYEIRQFAPKTKIVLISSHYTPHDALHLARLFSDGAFVTKAESGKQLIPVISGLLPEESKAQS